MAFVRVMLGIVGFALFVVALFEFTLWLQGTSQPQEITAREITSGGSISNIHVTVTDFFIFNRYVEGGMTRSRLNEAWIPVFILEDDGTISTPMRPLIAHVRGIADDPDRVNEIVKRSELTGIVGHPASQLGKKEKAYLHEIIVDGDIEQAIVLSVDKPFPSLFSLLGYSLSGLLLIGICIWLSLKGAKESSEQIDLPPLSEYKRT